VASGGLPRIVLVCIHDFLADDDIRNQFLRIGPDNALARLRWPNPGFPRIWVANWENRDLRQLLWHRHRMVQARTRIMNQLTNT